MSMSVKNSVSFGSLFFRIITTEVYQQNSWDELKPILEAKQGVKISDYPDNGHLVNGPSQRAENTIKSALEVIDLKITQNPYRARGLETAKVLLNTLA